MSKAQSILTRWLGVGLATVVCIVTLSLSATGRIGMYINPDGAWFAVGMSVVGVVAAIGSFLLPLGDEADHGHDHGTPSAAAHAVTHPFEDHLAFHAGAGSSRADAVARDVERAPVAEVPSVASVVDVSGSGGPADTAGLSRRELRELREAASRAIAVVPDAHAEVEPHDHPAAESHPRSDAEPHVRPVAEPHAHSAAEPHSHPAPPRRFWPTVAAASGGLIASAVVVLMLVLPPASLSAQAAADRDIGSPPLFGGDDVVVLAASGDVGSFGVGEWATVFATAGDPTAFDGVEVSLTGFLTEGDDGAARLSRLVVTHCVIDAQPASVTLTEGDADASVGQWLQVDGVVAAQEDGSLVINPTSVTAIDEPSDPYEY